MSESRKRPHSQTDTTSPEMLLIRNFATYENDEARIRLLDRLRKTPDGLNTMQNALDMITSEMKKIQKGDYPSNHRLLENNNSYVLMQKHLTSALDRDRLEKLTDTNLSIYSPTLGRRSE